MAHHGITSIVPTPLLARLSSPALLDTNGRFRRNNNSCNSFKTNDRVNSYSIQNELLLATKCSPALAPLTRHQRIRTSQDLISQPQHHLIQNSRQRHENKPQTKI